MNPQGGGRAKIENSSRRHPRKFSLKRFLAVRRSWRGSGVAYFWVTSFRKKISAAVVAAPSYLEEATGARPLHRGRGRTLHPAAVRPLWLRRTNVWRGITSPARGAKATKKTEPPMNGRSDEKMCPMSRKTWISVRSRNVWNGRWWVHVLYCSTHCEALHELERYARLPFDGSRIREFFGGQP